MKYLASDGKVFDTAEECMKHEDDFFRREEYKDEMLNKIESQAKKCSEEYKKLNKLMKEYVKAFGYKNYPEFTLLSEMESILGGLYGV